MSTLSKNYKTVSLKDRRKRIIGLFRYLVFDIARESFERRVLGKRFVEQRAEARNRRRAQRFVNAALELGGVLIKLGQYLSARFDLLPEVWIEELSRLQDSVPPVDFADLRPTVEEDLQGRVEDLFLEFNQSPLASASLGQVHEARLLDGSRVAVKVRRPGIDLIIEADLEALNRVIDFLSRRTNLGKFADLKGIAREFETTLRRELDYVREAQNAERFRANLQKLRFVYVPQVYLEQSSGRVLTTEFIDGFKVTDFDKIEAAGIDRHKAARVLANCYLNQLLIDGFFHADPHPGNLFIRKGPLGLQVVFIDFGMTGEITPQVRFEIRRMAYAILNRDIEGTLQSFRTLGFVRREEDLDKVRVGITYFTDKLLGRNLGEVKAMDKLKMLDEVSYLIYTQPLYLPGDFSFLSRAIDVLVGICTGLSPKLNFTDEARPFLDRLIAEELGSAQVAESLAGLGQFLNTLPGGETLLAFLKSPAGERLRANALQVVTLPATLSQTLEKLESGRIQVQFQSAEIKNASDRFQKSNERLLSGVLASGFLVSGVTLTATASPLWASLVCFFSAIFMGFRLFR